MLQHSEENIQAVLNKHDFLALQDEIVYYPILFINEILIIKKE